MMYLTPWVRGPRTSDASELERARSQASRSSVRSTPVEFSDLLHGVGRPIKKLLWGCLGGAADGTNRIITIHAVHRGGYRLGWLVNIDGCVVIARLDKSTPNGRYRVCQGSRKCKGTVYV